MKVLPVALSFCLVAGFLPADIARAQESSPTVHESEEAAVKPAPPKRPSSAPT